MSGDRLKCIAEVERLFGPRHRIYPNGATGLLVGRDLGGLIMGVAVSVKAGGYRALLAKLREYEAQQRRDQAHAWVHAAFDAAAEGYDVREPCRQIQEWITNGSKEG